MIRSEIYGKTLRFFLAPVADLLFEDESVTEVLINGPSTIYCERGGRLERVDRSFADEQVLMAAVQNLAEYVHRRIDDDHHSMDARLPEPDRFRVHVIIPPVSRQGPCVSIRKFRKSNTSLEWLISKGAMDEDSAAYLRLMVGSHRNLIVSGGTGAGKTSLLNALSAHLAPHERILVIEDSSELQLQQPHVLYLEAKPPKPDGKGAVTIRDLFVDSLRMRPDRIVVGEVRRGEALDMIQSMLTGHDGAMSTVHASNPLLALVRLETLCLMSDTHMPVYVARAQVASAIQVIVQVNRFSDGSRRLSAISEVEALDENEKYRVRDLYRFHVDGRDADGKIRGRLAPTGRKSRYSRLVWEYGHESEIGRCSVIKRAANGSRPRGTT
jgi:pilus assembly protein CpaF